MRHTSVQSVVGDIQMKKRVQDSIGIYISCIVFLLALTACSGQPAPKKHTTTPQVSVVEVRARTVLFTTELAGRTAAFQAAEVRPQVTGILQKRLFEEGATVEAGQPLYQIDATTYIANYRSAQAALKKAKANLAPARLRAERYRQLLRIQAVSQQECDDAVAAYKQAEADVAVNEAAVENARIQKEYTTIVAPIAGRVGQSMVTAGALLTANQANALVVIRALDTIYVDVTQSSLNLLELREKLATGALESAEQDMAVVRLKLENGKDYPHTGKLQCTDTSVDPTTGMVTLRAIFPNPDRLLLPGMYVRAIIDEGVQDKAICIPQRALLRTATGDAYVYIVDASGNAVKRPVTAARMLADTWLIAHGLAEGDRVIADGLQNVRAGHPVTIREVLPNADTPPPAHSKVSGIDYSGKTARGE